MSITPRYRPLVVAAGYFVGGYLGLSIPYIGSQITLIWPPTGIALAALLLWGYRIIPGIWLGAFLVNLATGASWVPSLGISIGNTLGPFAACLLLQRAGFERRMDKHRDVVIFVLAGAVLPMTITAMIGSLTLMISRLLPSAQWATAWSAWWWGDLLGVLLFTPPLISFDRHAARAAWTDFRTGREILLAMMLLIVSGLLIFLMPLHLGLPRQMDLLPAMFLIWIAAIWDIWFTSLAILVVGVLAILSTALGSGPFTGGDIGDNLIRLWEYLAGFTIIGLFVAAISASHRYDERELRLGRERMELALKGGDLGYWEVDLRTNRMIVNERWAEMLETSLAALTPRTRDAWLEALHPGDRDRVLAVGEDYREGRREHYEVKYRVVTRKGNIRWQLSRGAAIERDKNGKAILMVGTVMDITEAEESLHALMKAKEQAESADRLKSAFLATMSHELRTPLNSIIGFTGIILQGLSGAINEEQAKQLTMVKNSANHLLSLISEILDISKIEAGQLKVSAEPLDMRLSVHKVVQSIRPLAERKGLSLLVEIEDNMATITSDVRRVEQVLLNLLSNAVKFTERGNIRVSCGVENGRCLTCVTDTGIGIKQEQLEHLFKPFYQVDTGISRKYEGTGLGLSICKRLIELMGGSMRVESSQGKGSTFCFALPLERTPS